MILYVKKNSGVKQKFNLAKLTRSINESLKHLKGEGDKKFAQELTREALERLEGANKKIVQSDEIKQSIIHVLKHRDEIKLAESYEMSSLKIPDLKLRKVLKRNGRQEQFHLFKLFKSIKKSFIDAQVDPEANPERIMKEVAGALEKKFKDDPVPVEEIKKTVSDFLKKEGFAKVEKAYIMHEYL